METTKEIERIKFLCVIDASYMLYTALFGSVRNFMENCPDDAAYWIKPVEECDQDNLPNLLNCDAYKSILKKYVIRRLESVENIARENFPNEVNSADVIDIVFAMDDTLTHSFRKDMCPEYKAQRVLVKRQYQIKPIKDYIVDVIFKELDVENQHGYHLVKVEGAEGDDVIATTLMKLKDNYNGCMLIASDHDFLQIDGVREFDLFGKEAKRELGGEEVDAKDFLIGKILMGDRSDNIKQVINRCGPKTALKWVKDKSGLKKLLKEDASLAQRYIFNKKMISFEDIPKDLSDKIVEEVNKSLYSNVVMNPFKADDWSQWMMQL